MRVTRCKTTLGDTANLLVIAHSVWMFHPGGAGLYVESDWAAGTVLKRIPTEYIT